MKIRLYADEDSMERGLIRALRARDVDVLTPLEVGMVERNDSIQLEYAKSARRVLITYNVKDFARLHKIYTSSGKTHAGLILIRQQEYSIGEALRRILKLIDTLDSQEMENRTEYLGGWK